MTPPLIHIGFHKTASSLLQRRLFLMEDLGFHLLESGRGQIHQAFITHYGLDPAPEGLIDTLRAKQKAAAEKGGTLVISHERLSGYPASGGFDQGLIAERLADAFPDGKVVMLIREQKRMIYSMYLQTITDGGTLSLRRFLNHPEPILMRKPGFNFGYYEYDRLIAKYHALFGPENVLVIAFEAFQSDLDTHARALTAFALGPDAAKRLDVSALSEEVNPARPLALQAIRRHLNKLVRNQLNENGVFPISNEHVEHVFRRIMPVMGVLHPFDKLIHGRLTARVAEACAGRYAASNARVQEMTGLDLSALGYEV